MRRTRITLTGLLAVFILVGCGRRRDLAPSEERGGAREVAAASVEVDSSREEPSDSAEESTRCDRDSDGALSEDCGGDDCNDSDPHVYPGAVEYCNFKDDDCDGENNEDEFCGIYVHTSDRLLLIEPFVGVEVEAGAVPGLLDFDTAPDGTLYGITTTALFQFDEVARSWDRVGDFGTMDGSTNGFAISSTEVGFATSGNTLYEIGLNGGDALRIGEFGANYSSSGDCVVNKSGRLFLSSDHDLSEDHLMEVDTSTGEARVIGPIGFVDVYGLTFAWGELFGFTGRGEVIRINSATGSGELLHTFSDRSFWGAASSPER